MDEEEGKVQPLFKDRLTAAGLPPQQDIVQLLEALMLEAVAGKVTGLAVITFSPSNESRQVTAGKLPYLTFLGSLTEFIHVIMQTRRN